VRSGDRLALAGPNGSGKTTLLRVLSGAALPGSGSVELDGAPLQALGPRKVARRIAVVAQHVDTTISFTVRELVSMGRTPYIGLLSGETTRDRAAVDRALHDTETRMLANRRFSELSGGEQQRVMVAVGLAQETDFLLLDEPTVHLDLRHQHDLLELLLQLNRDRQIGVIAVLHDLNLAALYFERLAVLERGRIVAAGPPADVMTHDVLEQVFGTPLRIIAHPATGLPQVLLDPALPPNRAQ
jgi:iron complex transport system ATP-binding protein